VTKTRDRLDAARADMARISGRLAALPAPPAPAQADPAPPAPAPPAPAQADPAQAGSRREDG
jgi:hypothetical protein